MPRSAPAPRSRGRPAGRVVTTRSATASRGRPTTRPGPSQPRQRAATQPASPPPNTTRPRSRSARSRDRLELDTDLVRPHHVTDPTDNDLRQQFDSLRQTVEGLVGVVQQLANQAATREATTPAVIAATPPDVAAPVYLLPTAATSTTSAYMPPTGAPPPTPLAELAAPSGELNAVPVVLEQQTQRPILFAAGLPAGYHISEKLKARIWTHKYIDFNDITTNASNTSTYTMSLIDNGTPTLNFAPQRKRPLTETEWCTAWDDFLAVYTQKYPHHLTDLITYSRHIKELMQTGADWRHYDHQFRVDREYSLCSWAAVRVDLQLAATLRRTQQPFRPAFPPRPVQHRPQSQSSRPPPGYCFTFHAPNVRCEMQNCPFKHTCPKCKGKHPMYRPCHSRQYTTTPGRTHRPANANPHTNTK